MGNYCLILRIGEEFRAKSVNVDLTHYSYFFKKNFLLNIY